MKKSSNKSILKKAVLIFLFLIAMASFIVFVVMIIWLIAFPLRTNTPFLFVLGISAILPVPFLLYHFLLKNHWTEENLKTEDKNDTEKL